jgi:transketolase
LQLEQKIKAEAKPDNGEKIQVGISKAMITAFKKGYPILSVTSDLPGSTGVAGFRKEFADACFDVGVAESNMISTAAGLSKQGFIPVVDTFAQFGVTKGALPLTMASLSEAPIIGIFSHTGFQDAADGASHQALSYMSMLATIPGVDLYSLSSSEEAEALMTAVIEEFVQARGAGKTPHSSIFFLGRENFPKTFKTESNQVSYKLAKPEILKENLVSGKNVLLITTGSLVGEALKASDQLKEKSVGSIVVNVNSLNKINAGDYKEMIQKCGGNIVTVEDHQVLLGLGSLLTHQFVQAGLKVQVKSLGVHAEFGQSAYNAIELYRKHKMDSDSITKAALAI